MAEEQVLAANYYHTVTYRRCEDCGFSGEDTAFKQKTEISSQGPSWACMNTTIHCPHCDSENLSPHYYDSGFHVPCREPQIIFLPNTTILAPNKPQ